jgi:hypothetical protein
MDTVSDPLGALDMPQQDVTKLVDELITLHGLA